jgi:hypothetical protein
MRSKNFALACDGRGPFELVDPSVRHAKEEFVSQLSHTMRLTWVMRYQGHQYIRIEARRKRKQ